MSNKNHFDAINRRILWLSDKIAWAQANHKPFNFYYSEREALIWACDKIKHLSTQLLRLTSSSSDDNRDDRDNRGNIS